MLPIDKDSSIDLMNSPQLSHISDSIAAELRMIFAAHRAAGLEGAMALYTLAEQTPWRSKEPGLRHWFSEQEIPQAIEYIFSHYNGGELPNSPLLLDPIIHRAHADGRYEPLGSGIFWATALCLGVDRLNDESLLRMRELGVLASCFHRSQNLRAGLKMVGISNEKLLPAEEDARVVPGCRALYELADIESKEYWPYYLLSGLSYLSLNGSFTHPDVFELFEDRQMPQDIAARGVSAQRAVDAALCWNAYDRHQLLYARFGIDTAKVEENLHYFNLCARDISLYDATGPMRASAVETLEFVVPGYIPRGSVTLLAAAGGTGKSSVAHQLCVLAAIDYAPGEEAPRWLGQPVNTELTRGICVYFSGEDGPAIINARAELFDPESRARRLMFQRVDFGEGKTIADFLERLKKMPHVPIMVIDPARKYLDGDENDADVVSRFFEAIEEFAISKNTAVIVVHHLQKGANPKSAREVLDELRGSQVFIDRPRVVLGMYRDGPHTVVGLAKCNIPPNLGMVVEERVFVRNPKNLQLIWLPGEAGIRGKYMTDEELEALAQQSYAEHH